MKSTLSVRKKVIFYLIGLPYFLTGCGESQFGSGEAKPKGNGSTEPQLEQPQKQQSNPDLVQTGNRPGKAIDKGNPLKPPGTTTSVSGLGNFTTVRGTGTVTNSSQIPATFTTLSIPTTSANGATIKYIGTFEGAQNSRPPCPNGLVLGNRCLEALKIFQWNKEERRFFTTKADSTCSRFAPAGCSGLNLADNGFTYESFFGNVFKETAIAGIGLEGNTPTRVVLCHQGFLNTSSGDTIVVNPTDAQVSSLDGSCALGAESFILLASPAEGTAGVFVWKKGNFTRLSFSATAAPSSGYVLDTPQPIGYGIDP